MNQSTSPLFNPKTRPVELTIDRAGGAFRIRWQDGEVSVHPLSWLRENCPCATCVEQRLDDADGLESGIMKLNLPPSYEVTDATLVGNYAIQLEWADGHAAGIYAFSALRSSWDQGEVDNPNG